jgi:putative Ca2+/H+ antiporter (TMEM165/GDT1 family)
LLRQNSAGDEVSGSFLLEESLMHAFWIALFIVFVAEMGDKTQFMTLSFSTRYRAWTVMAGVFIATLAISLLSALLGEALGSALPLFWLNLLAGLLFIAFGLWTLRDEKEATEKSETKPSFGPLVTIAMTFFVAELGDRTMLATVLVASQQRNFIAVWLGSTLGLFLANALAVIVGKMLGKRLPEKALKYGTAIIFIASGLLAFYAAWRHR